jgi:hypothetical protein
LYLRADNPLVDARRFAPAALAALGAALVGAVVWGLIVKLTEYEIGIVAWAIGFLAGTAAVLVARDARGRPLQVAAVVAALLGILVGKYLSFAWEIEELGERFGLETVEIYSTAMMRAFRDSLADVFGWFDLLWAGLAVFTAWRATMPAAPEPSSPPEV